MGIHSADARAYFDRPDYVRFNAGGREICDDNDPAQLATPSRVTRSNLVNAIATGAGTIVAGGYLDRSGLIARYSAGGPNSPPAIGPTKPDALLPSEGSKAASRGAGGGLAVGRACADERHQRRGAAARAAGGDHDGEPPPRGIGPPFDRPPPMRRRRARRRGLRCRPIAGARGGCRRAAPRAALPARRLTGQAAATLRPVAASKPCRRSWLSAKRDGFVDPEPRHRRHRRLDEAVAGAQRHDLLDAVVLDVVDGGAGGAAGADQHVLGADAEGHRAGVAAEARAARGGQRQVERAGQDQPAVGDAGRRTGSSPASRRSPRRRCRAARCRSRCGVPTWTMRPSFRTPTGRPSTSPRSGRG